MAFLQQSCKIKRALNVQPRNTMCAKQRRVYTHTHAYTDTHTRTHTGTHTGTHADRQREKTMVLRREEPVSGTAVHTPSHRVHVLQQQSTRRPALSQSNRSHHQGLCFVRTGKGWWGGGQRWPPRTMMAPPYAPRMLTHCVCPTEACRDKNK